LRICRQSRHPESSLATSAQSFAARDGDERREETASISYILLLIAEFHLSYFAEEAELCHE